MTETGSPAPNAPDARPADAPPADAPRHGRFKLWLDSVGGFFTRDRDGSPGGMRPTGGVRREKYTQPRVLFVCTGNTARSQICEAFAAAYGLYAESAGTWPAPKVQDEARIVMDEIGIDISGMRPKLLDPRRLEAFDRVVNLGDSLPADLRRAPNVESWPMMDPNGLPLHGYRALRNQCEKMVRRLSKDLGRKQQKIELPA